MMAVWKKPFDLDALNQANEETLIGQLGIRITAVAEDSLSGTMPVDARTRQPFGYLHGGASAALAETLGSIGAHFATPEGTLCLGQGLQIHHLRSAKQGIVTGTARPLHLGQSSHVWDIEIADAQGQRIAVARLTVMARQQH